MRSLFYQAYAFLKRDYLVATTYRMPFLFQAVTVLFATPTLFYLGRLIEPAASPHLAPYGATYFSFVILGVAVSGLLALGMGAFAAALRQEQMIGTLEPLLAAPVSLAALAVGASLWSFLLGALQTALYLWLGATMFGVNLARANLGAAALVLGLAVVAYVALGVIAAAVVLLFKQSDPLTGILAAASVLLAGVFYPPAVLPPALARLGQLIPLTHALRAIRLALLQGAGITAMRTEVLVLLVFACLGLPLSLLIFRWAVVQAKTAGGLGAY